MLDVKEERRMRIPLHRRKGKNNAAGKQLKIRYLFLSSPPDIQ